MPPTLAIECATAACSVALFEDDVLVQGRFDVLGRSISARVTSVRLVEWSESRAGGFMFVFRPGPLSRARRGYLGSKRRNAKGPAWREGAL